MGILTRLAAWYIGKSTQSNPESWFIDWVRGGSKSATGITINQLSALRNATVMAAVGIRSIDLAKCPVHVYSLAKTGEQIIQTDHPLERILRRPNSWQTRLEFIEQMQMALLLKCNAYAAIKRNGRGRPTELIPINPDRVNLWEAPDGSFWYDVMRGGLRETALLREFPQKVPSEDMMHLRAMPLDGINGLSRIGLLRESIGLGLAQEESAARLFGNGARPSGFLQTDKRLTDPVFKRLREQIRSKWQGMENTGEIPVLEEGLKWQQATMSFVDSEFIKGREFQVAEIARAFDVPPHRLGINPEGGGPAILQAHQMYLNNTVSSDAERWEAKFNDIFDLDGENEFVEFDLDYFNRADELTRVNAARVAVIGSLRTPNEFRRREGLGDKPHGDDLLQPANVVPLGTPPQTGAGPGSDTTGKPAEGGDGSGTEMPEDKLMVNGHAH